jgi:hypothetical protein
MINHLQFGFSQFISFREEDLWNFSQSEHIIGPGSHVEYLTGTKNRNFVEDHPRNIPAKFGSNWPSGFGERSLKCEKLTDDGCQVMAIVPMDLWSRWTKKLITNSEDHANGHQQRYSAYQYNQIKVIWYGANPCWIWCW